MKRKTNLFYLSGDDSNFISFSNYSESLTGNILSTDWKLFPSKFLCLYIKLLDVDNHDLYIERKESRIFYGTDHGTNAGGSPRAEHRFYSDFKIIFHYFDRGISPGTCHVLWFNL